MKTKKAFVEVRSQKSKGTGPGSGPDTYFAVQIVPEGVTPLVALNHKAAMRRGIEIVYCGEGYSDRQKTSRSMYNQAKAEAERIAAEVNNA